VVSIHIAVFAHRCHTSTHLSNAALKDSRLCLENELKQEVMQMSFTSSFNITRLYNNRLNSES